MAPAGLPPAHVGISAGPLVIRDDDVFGSTVNIAARLSYLAPPGDIFMTEADRRE